MHVDAAWAGSAALVPEQRHWFKGLDKVDSYSFNPHSKCELTNTVTRGTMELVSSTHAWARMHALVLEAADRCSFGKIYLRQALAGGINLPPAPRDSPGEGILGEGITVCHCAVVSVCPAPFFPCRVDGDPHGLLCLLV